MDELPKQSSTTSSTTTVPLTTVPAIPRAEPTLSELREQCDVLRHLLVSALVLMIVVSGTLNIYFWREFKTAKGELEARRPQINANVADYQRNWDRQINDFVVKLQQYGASHKDFEPIMTKYGIKPQTNTAPATTPAPTIQKK